MSDFAFAHTTYGSESDCFYLEFQQLTEPYPEASCEKMFDHRIKVVSVKLFFKKKPHLSLPLLDYAASFSIISLNTGLGLAGTTRLPPIPCFFVLLHK